LTTGACALADCTIRPHHRDGDVLDLRRLTTATVLNAVYLNDAMDWSEAGGGHIEHVHARVPEYRARPVALNGVGAPTRDRNDRVNRPAGRCIDDRQIDGHVICARPRGGAHGVLAGEER
jgi:hypothetical protein